MLTTIFAQADPNPLAHRDFVIRVGLAIVLGGLIGLEREVRDKPAGFRTIILICLGACVFAIISQVVGGPDHDHSRIAAQIVTGIGFLGAGAILRDHGSVIGLTTASTIWAVAAVGMAVGFGQLALAGMGTLAIFTALFVFNAIEQAVGDRRDIQEYRFTTPYAEDVWDRVEAKFDAARLCIRKQKYHRQGSALVFFVVAMGAKPDHERLRREFIRSEEFEIFAL